jgi:hypothetical protein
MQEEVKFRQMPLICECGFIPIRLRSVGFTAEYELVVHWRCPACGKLVYAIKPLADCCRDCPESDHDLEVALLSASSGPGVSGATGVSDAAFLQSMGIRLLED